MPITSIFAAFPMAAMPPLQGDISARRDFELSAFGPVNRVELIQFAGESCRASNRRSHSIAFGHAARERSQAPIR